MEPACLPRTIEEIYKDYKGRRDGLVKALTSDVEEFYNQCDPEKENLCLYGHPDATWEVNLPAEEVPPELPEPALGINFPRNGLERRDWLSLIAIHSDVWLLAVSSFYAARFDQSERKRLFNMINELPTVLEVVSGKKQSLPKEKPSVNINGTKLKSSGKSGKPAKQSAMPRMPKEEDELQRREYEGRDGEEEEEEEEEEGEEEGEGEEMGGDEEHGDTFCGRCGGPYTGEEFWIGCDICEKWYHGKCVKITPAKAEHIEQYKCPLCIGNKRPRPSS